MLGFPLDVWAMMGFSVLVFIGGSLWALVYTLREEERKLRIVRTEGTLDTHSPTALRDLRTWIDAHPNDRDVEAAQTIYGGCVETLQTTDRHFYDWTEAEIERLSQP